jgi:predicted HAD superfamily Cof-like phosphohydrolase
MQGLDLIIKFQKDRELDKQKYRGLNEQVNIVEELLESAGLDTPKDNRPQLMESFSDFIEEMEALGTSVRVDDLDFEDMVDAYADIIVFAVGSIMKLGYDPKLVLKEVGKEINSRVGSIKNGKFEKDLSKKDQWYKANYSTCKLPSIN